MKNKIVVRISEKKTAGRMIDFFMLTAEYGELYLHSWEYTPGVYDFFRSGRMESELYRYRKWKRNPRLDNIVSRLPAYIKYAVQTAAEDALWENWQPSCTVLRTEAA